MLKAFTMGEKVQQAANQAGFGHVIMCPPDIKKTVIQVKEEFIHD